MAGNGVDDVVGTLGTATTPEHLRRIFRATQEITFCFDGDRAGRDAAWRALQTSLPEMRDGRQVGFLFLTEGEDPDSVVRQEGGGRIPKSGWINTLPAVGLPAPGTQRANRYAVHGWPCPIRGTHAAA